MCAFDKNYPYLSNYHYTVKPVLSSHSNSDSFTILGLWVLGLAVSNINESQLQTYESFTLFLMTSLQYYCIPGLAEIKTCAQKMQDAQVTKSLLKRKPKLVFTSHYPLMQVKSIAECSKWEHSAILLTCIKG